MSGSPKKKIAARDAFMRSPNDDSVLSVSILNVNFLKPIKSVCPTKIREI